MSRWKKVLVFNAGWLIGITISLFVVPPSTPLWMWASLSILVLALLNYVSFKQKREAASGRNIAAATTVVWLGIIVLLLDLLVRHLRH